MGCIFTRPPGEVENPRTFRVVNVDDHGEERNPGRIEISDSELIWYQRNKEPVRWPLKSLRRYGFDAELFSFESGRRCPTGPGIYAFKCRRAEALFNLLQECIQRQRTGQEDGLPGRHHVAEPIPNNRPASLVESQPSQPSPQRSGQQPPHLNGHQYINTAQGLVQSSNIPGIVVDVLQGPSSQIQYAELDLPRPSDDNASLGMEGGLGTAASNGHCQSQSSVEDESQLVGQTYVNVPTGSASPCKNSSALQVQNGIRRHSSSEELHSYANVDLPSTAQGLSQPIDPSPGVQYIQLDLQSTDTASGIAGGSTNSSTSPASNPESPTRKTETYARIDFDKTWALNAITSDKDDDGARKTRHNSSIDDLY